MKNYSESHQTAYLNYVLITTLISAIMATGTTLSFIFPAISISVFIIAAILTVSLMALFLEIWLDFTFNEHKPSLVKTSHSQMQLTLGAQLKSENSYSPAPYHDSFLQAHKKQFYYLNQPNY